MEQLTGIYVDTRKNGTTFYRSSITFQNKHISLGSYPLETDAHKAYQEAKTALYTASLTPEDYETSQILPFEKWVVLINFRNNSLYFSTPIYLYSRFFLYYLSQDEVFKFDSEDLFYFGSRKIMRRGKHYFVADFGMQVSVPSRFGIRSYSVEGRDYKHVNGDLLDFRRENILLVNRYRGVLKQTINAKTIYRCQIHVGGNVHVGDFTREDDAAIAYNKAIDLLYSAGIRKNYSPNELDGISPSTYANIYTSLTLAKSFERYLHRLAHNSPSIARDNPQN